MLKGIYTLIIKLQKRKDITVGKLGTISFVAGYYVYVGSALNGLSPRIIRHLKADKSLHWHVDYLLCGSKIVDIVYGLSQKRKECILASQLAKEMTPVLGFGCSDCSCKSHLLFCKDFYQAGKIVRSGFKRCGLVSRRWK
jgi:Uri superfamily endonuclease